MGHARRTLSYAGTNVVVEADDTRFLLEVLRGELSVRSASRGCTEGTCGACRVMVDGALVSSCRVPWGDVRDGACLETYELLEKDPAATRAVNAFATERPTRCRLCIGALGVTAVFVARSDRPKDEAIEGALVNATCLCTGRGSLRRALAK